ncbi:unnamed protein product, partial [Mesorhabditis belari]|uniref:Uncharacterized protein n=1 Tax=Mesorhabditis belari TaxID=2138241 RepID=A0AAF3EE03_9BILA
MEMSTRISFFRGVDSLEVHANVLEVVHQEKTLRFAYPDNSDGRKFAVKMDKNVRVFLPEMTLEYQSEGVWLRTEVVGFCAEFIDMVKFAAFLTKLSNIAGYQQLVVSDGDSSQEMEEDEDDSQSDQSDEYISMNPEYSILKDYTAMAVTPQHIELVVAGKTLRFAHGPLVPRPLPRPLPHGRGRGAGAGAQGAPGYEYRKARTQPKDKWMAYVIPGVILQDLANQQYVDVFEVDLYIEFDNGDLHSDLLLALKANNYFAKK